MKRKSLIFGLLLLASLPLMATKMMVFHGMARYSGAASNILIVQCISQEADKSFCRASNLKILKGDRKERALRLESIFNQMQPGNRYLFFSFGSFDDADRTIIDNGELSPVLIPVEFKIDSLNGKPIEEQISLIINARLKEIDASVKELESERMNLMKAVAPTSAP